MNANAPRPAGRACPSGPMPGPDDSSPLAALLEAVAAEAQPLLAAGRTGRIVINFSGGDKVRIETARFRDVSVGPHVK